MDMDDAMIDDLVNEHRREQREEALWVRNEARTEALHVRSKLLELSDQEFLEVILMNTVNLYEHPRTSLNNVAPKFPAGDIAVKHRDNKLALTDKQKMAIANVYIYAHLGVRLSKQKK